MSDNNNVAAAFGRTKMNGDTGPKFPVRLKDGHNVVRIIPAFKSLAQKGSWFFYHKQHFGYGGVDKKNPGKTRQRPFKCPQEKNQNKMIVVPCAECDLLENRALLLKQKEAELTTCADKSMRKVLEEQVKSLKDFAKVHNLDKKYYMNVKWADGTFGTVGIGYKAYTALKTAMKQLQEKHNIDPFDPQQGVWFDFFKEGEGLATEVSVSVVEQFEEVNGRRYSTVKPAPLTMDDLEKAFNDCNDLPFVVKSITQKQIQQLVDSGGDDAEAVDLIWDQGTRSTERSASPAVEASPEPVKAAPAVVAAPVAVVNVTAAVDDEEAALLAQLAAARAKKAAAATQVVETAAPAAAVTSMDDDAFLKMFRDQ